jgi:hypothetical protein
MRNTLQKMRALYVLLIVSMLLYIHAMTTISVPSYKSLNPTIYLALIFLGANTLGAGQMLRHFSRRTTVEKLRTNRDDPQALRRWRSGLMVSGVMAESLAAFGLFVYLSGGSRRQVALFFVACALALVIWWPRKP